MLEFIALGLRAVGVCCGLVFLGICGKSLFQKQEVSSEAFLWNSASREKQRLSAGETSVGRSKTCDVVLNFPTISRFHAVIAQRDGRWWVIDTSSHASTKVGELPVSGTAELQHGQCLVLGGVSFLFCEREDVGNL